MGNTEYKKQFNLEKYDRIELTVPKGKREELRAYAEGKGMSLNAYIKKLLSDDSGIDL